MIDLMIQPGEEVKYQGATFKIRRVIDLSQVLAENLKTGNLLRIPIKDLHPKSLPSDQATTIPKTIELSEKEWSSAQKKYEVIKPLLNAKGDGQLVAQRAKETGINKATIYRWLEKYERAGSVALLAESRGKALRGRKKLSKETEEILKQGIEEVYKTRQRRKIGKVINFVIKKCRDLGIEEPHQNTIRKRIREINEFELTKKRYGTKIARENFDPNYGSFPGADHPLSIVQIDHTPVDLILVDEINRIPIGRPWITVAIDVYSRMIVGYYLSFDSPNFLSVGLCISHSILPKEKWLLNLGVDGEWPCWGKMKTIHTDNAKEFRSKAMERSCMDYGINIEWRPCGKPYWGGHIERLLGTFAKEIHDLPGTTFSNTKERKEYKSEKKAALTLKEFEKWLATFIVNVYHKRIHSSLSMSPLEKFEQGIMGTNGQSGVGLQPRITDESRIKLDFMPYVERTVQEYGVMIENIHYYSDVIKKWVHKTDLTSGKAKLKKKFIFKYDPRDLSCVYFFDPELKDYFQMPYRDLSKPPITIWEYRAVKKKLKDDGIKNVDEDKIFVAFEKMKEIELEAVSKTKKTKLARAIGRKTNSDKIVIKKKVETSENYENIDITSLTPFE